jgi:hypothetical protein
MLVERHGIRGQDAYDGAPPPPHDSNSLPLPESLEQLSSITMTTALVPPLRHHRQSATILNQAVTHPTCVSFLNLKKCISRFVAGSPQNVIGRRFPVVPEADTPSIAKVLGSDSTKCFKFQ